MTTLEEAIAIFSQFAETGGHKEYLGHLDSRLDPFLEVLLDAAKKQLKAVPPGEASIYAQVHQSYWQGYDRGVIDGRAGSYVMPAPRFVPAPGEARDGGPR